MYNSKKGEKGSVYYWSRPTKTEGKSKLSYYLWETERFQTRMPAISCAHRGGDAKGTSCPLSAISCWSQAEGGQVASLGFSLRSVPSAYGYSVFPELAKARSQIYIYNCLPLEGAYSARTFLTLSHL